MHVRLIRETRTGGSNSPAGHRCWLYCSVLSGAPTHRWARPFAQFDRNLAYEGLAERNTRKCWTRRRGLEEF
jgi:hypothetical protein